MPSLAIDNSRRNRKGRWLDGAMVRWFDGAGCRAATSSYVVWLWLWLWLWLGWKVDSSC